MSIKIKKNDSDNDIFEIIENDDPYTNQRSAVRYIRNDISTSIKKIGFFSSSKFIPINLLDISSKGIAVECEKKLTINKKIIIRFIFKDRKKFIISAKVVYQSQINKKNYGIKFERYHHELGDHLLHTSNDLVFK